MNGLVLISFMVMCEQPDFLLVVAAVYSLLAISSISNIYNISTSFFETSHATASSFHICSETKTHYSISVLFEQPIMLYQYVLFSWGHNIYLISTVRHWLCHWCAKRSKLVNHRMFRLAIDHFQTPSPESNLMMVSLWEHIALSIPNSDAYPLVI